MDDLIRQLPSQIAVGLGVAAIVAVMVVSVKKLKYLSPSRRVVEGFRSDHGVRPLRTLENGLKVEQLPNGVYGYVYTYVLDKSFAPSITLESSRNFPRIVEVHKSASGDLFVVGFVDQGSLIRLQNQSRTEPVETHVFFKSYKGFSNPVCIPYRGIVASNARTVAGKEMCDMRIEGVESHNNLL